jgi:pimeloyl-ACP methyl ester carboxylesterase
MASIVLIHGAWHQGSCWKYVQPLLEARGHVVYAPSLRLERDATVSTHVEQVVELIERHGLHEVILVGHSYGGMVIAGVMARLPDRFAHAVFLDAILPEHGRSGAGVIAPLGIVPPIAWLTQGQMFPVLVTAAGFGVRNADDIRWLDQVLQPHPASTLLAPYPYRPPYDPRRCTYLAAREPMRITRFDTVVRRAAALMLPFMPFTIFADRARRWGWSVAEINCGHNIMMIEPAEVARHILAIVPEGGL